MGSCLLLKVTDSSQGLVLRYNVSRSWDFIAVKRWHPQA